MRRAATPIDAAILDDGRWLRRDGLIIIPMDGLAQFGWRVQDARPGAATGHRRQRRLATNVRQVQPAAVAAAIRRFITRLSISEEQSPTAEKSRNPGRQRTAAADQRQATTERDYGAAVRKCFNGRT